MGEGDVFVGGFQGETWMNTDGLSLELFHILRQRASPSAPACVIKVPETLVYAAGSYYFENWYRSDELMGVTATTVNELRRHQSLNKLIFEKIVEGNKKLEVVASLYRMFPNGDNRNRVTVEYLTRESLANFLAERRKPSQCILQKFVKPFGTHSTMTRVVWSPRVFYAERRVNFFPIDDKHYPLEDRLACFENLKECPSVCGGNLPYFSSRLREKVLERLKETCELIATHVRVHTNLYVKGMVIYFKVDEKKRLWLLYCESLRCARSVGVPLKDRLILDGPMLTLPQRKLKKQGTEIGQREKVDQLNVEREIANMLGPEKETQEKSPKKKSSKTKGKLRNISNMKNCDYCTSLIEVDSIHSVSYEEYLSFERKYGQMQSTTTGVIKETFSEHMEKRQEDIQKEQVRQTELTMNERRSEELSRVANKVARRKSMVDMLLTKRVRRNSMAKSLNRRTSQEMKTEEELEDDAKRKLVGMIRKMNNAGTFIDSVLKSKEKERKSLAKNSSELKQPSSTSILSAGSDESSKNGPSKAANRLGALKSMALLLGGSSRRMSKRASLGSLPEGIRFDTSTASGLAEIAASPSGERSSGMARRKSQTMGEGGKMASMLDKLKSSGTFKTDDPFASWDPKLLREVVENHRKWKQYDVKVCLADLAGLAESWQSATRTKAIVPGNEEAYFTQVMYKGNTFLIRTSKVLVAKSGQPHTAQYAAVAILDDPMLPPDECVTLRASRNEAAHIFGRACNPIGSAAIDMKPSDSDDVQIPPLFVLMYPTMTKSEYARLADDPVFLGHRASLCTGCYMNLTHGFLSQHSPEYQDKSIDSKYGSKLVSSDDLNKVVITRRNSMLKDYLEQGVPQSPPKSTPKSPPKAKTKKFKTLWYRPEIKIPRLLPPRRAFAPGNYVHRHNLQTITATIHTEADPDYDPFANEKALNVSTQDQAAILLHQSALI